ncbi:MAG: ATP-binding protein [Planctomycetota bacterium]|jgi:anti-sigma regulatory factor (Ser/Thr protein kinase)
MEELALHVLDVAENSTSASASLVEVRVDEDESEDVMRITIADDGEGMSEETQAEVMDPFFTTKPGHPTGMGVPMFAQAAREAGGNLHVESSPGAGTRVVATFRLSHPDRMPLGDLWETMAVLVCSHPGVDFVCSHIVNGETVGHVDTRRSAAGGPSEGTDQQCRS